MCCGSKRAYTDYTMSYNYSLLVFSIYSICIFLHTHIYICYIIYTCLYPSLSLNLSLYMHIHTYIYTTEFRSHAWRGALWGFLHSAREANFAKNVMCTGKNTNTSRPTNQSVYQQTEDHASWMSLVPQRLSRAYLIGSSAGGYYTCYAPSDAAHTIWCVIRSIHCGPQSTATPSSNLLSKAL